MFRLQPPDTSTVYRASCRNLPIMRRIFGPVAPQSYRTSYRCRSAEAAEAKEREADLEFLLTPQPGEKDGAEAARELGKKYASLRRQRGLYSKDVARSLGTTRSRISRLELGEPAGAAGPFGRYIQYADLLGVTMREVFNTRASL